MKALFLATKQPAGAIEKWTAALQTYGAPVRHVALWSGPGNIGRRQDASTCNVDAFLLGPNVSVESRLAQYAGGEGLLIVSIDPALQHVPRAGVVFLVWQPQVPQDIVQACLALPPSLADASAVKGLLLVDPSPSLTLSVTHKALESAGLHGMARKPTVLSSRAAQGAMQALLQLADTLPAVPMPLPDVPCLPGAVRIAVARDDAFGPCFQENLALLHQAGAQLSFFSPLYDACIPSGTACIYLSSGPLEPERWQQLASNRPLLAAVRAFAEAGGLVLGEGAGLLYLSRTVDLDEEDDGHKRRVHDMAGVLPFKARLLPEPQTAAVQLHVSAGNPLFPAGSQLRGYLCSHASMVLVEERPLQSLGLGLLSSWGGGALGGKGSHGSPLSTTYKVTLVPQDGSLDRAESAMQPAPEAMPEGYTVQNVLASSCFAYLPSEPALAAQLVRRCACIDVAALAAGMAHNLGSSMAAKSGSSRVGSRRQSIQDVSALGAAYGNNGGGGGGGNGGLGGPGSCVAQAGHQFYAPHCQLQGAALPPRVPSCGLSENEGSGGAATCSPQCVRSPQQPSCHLSHSSSGSTVSSGLLQLSKTCLAGASDPAPGQQDACEQREEASSTALQPPALPPLYPCRGSPMPGGGRASQETTPRLGSQQASPLLPNRCGGASHGRPASLSPCSTVSNMAGAALNAKPAGAAGDGAPADAFPAAFDSPLRWPGKGAGSAGCMAGQCSPGQAVGMERSSSCANPGALALGADYAAVCSSSQAAMHHTSSTGALPSYGLGVGNDALERQYAAAPRHGFQEVGPSLAHAGAGYGWGAGMTQPPGGQAWSPGMHGRPHAATSLFGQLNVASSTGHGVVCCAPGACEALVAMGLANRLAGIGSDCDHPADVCASRRVVFSWVPADEAPQGAAARGIRIIRPCGGGGGGNFTNAPGAHNGLLPSAGCAGRGVRPSVDRYGGRGGGRVLLLDELALRQEAPSVLVLPDVAELSDLERIQLEQALVEMGLQGPAGGSGGSCSVLSVSCRTLVDVMDLILELGAAAGDPQAASVLLERLQARLRRVMAATFTATSGRPTSGMTAPCSVPLPVSAGKRPRVLVLQSLQPLVEPGRWVPEMLAMAGGTACLAVPGGADVQLTWQDVRERAAPDVLILLTPPMDAEARAAPVSASSAPPGGPSSQSAGVGSLQEQLAVMAAQPGWWCLPAVRVSQVYLMQSAYCVRPGPRLVDGVELLARLLMPGHYASSRKVPAGAVMRLSLAAGQRCRATLLPSYFTPVIFG